ncbi:MAG: hypothetical protein WCV62_02880 [Candidatus Peribacteraceae bacterium]|jgi:hypothetical protein
MAEPSVSAGIAATPASENGHDEELRLHFREHWLRLAPATLAMLTVSVIIAGGLFLFLSAPFADDPDARHVALVTAAVAFGLTQVLFTVKVLTYNLSLTIVTTRRIRRIHKSLFFTDNQTSIEIMEAQDTSKSQRGILPSLLGFGSIFIRAERTAMQMEYVPHVDRIYEKLLQLLNEIKREKTAEKALPPEAPRA